MARRNKTPPSRLWKRKRGRIVEARLRSASTRLGHLGEEERFALLAHRVVLPLLLADTARRLGSSTVSPRDFHCGCAPCATDGLPVCEGAKPDCRFAGRWTPESAAAAETRDALDEYEYQWELASTAYCGKRIPAAVERALLKRL